MGRPRARRTGPKRDELVAGRFCVEPFTDAQVDYAVAEARRLGFVHFILVGERGDARCGLVNGNCASLRHVTEVLDGAMNQIPAWASAGIQGLVPAKIVEPEDD